MNRVMWAELSERNDVRAIVLSGALSEHNDVRAIVLSGAGERCCNSIL